MSGTQVTLQGTLFGSNEPGFTFEPWDITTLYQDRAGTTPVTAAGQSVGLRLDKSQGLRQGPELVTNGTFGANITGWSNTGSSTSIWESGAARWSTATADFSGFRSASFATVVGRTYEFTATVLENTGAAWRIILVNGDGSYSNGTDNYTTPGTRTARFIATQTTSFVEIRNGTAATANRLIDNISVRELAGNHEVAVSDAKRGVYGWMPKTGRRNLLTYTEQFDNAAWVKLTGATAPSAKSVSFSADGFSRITQTISIASATSLTMNVKFSIDDVGKVVRLGLWSSGLDGLTTGNSGNLTIPPSGVVSFTWSSVTSASTIGIVNSSAAASQTLTVAENGGPQLELGSTATAYQRVNSQYDVTEAGVPTCYYVQADGVDDAYVTPTITPNTDKVQVFAGVRKLSDATTIFAELSASLNSNNGTFYVVSGLNPLDGLHFSSKGTISSLASFSTGSVFSAVVSGLGDISGDTATLRINGTQVAQSTADQGTGNFLAYPAYIYGRGGTSLPFNGLDFGHAVRFGPNLDAATIARVEALIARNTPEVTL